MPLQGPFTPCLCGLLLVTPQIYKHYCGHEQEVLIRDIIKMYNEVKGSA